MIELTAAEVATMAGGFLGSAVSGRQGPVRVSIDSRAIGAGELFCGIRGASVDGGLFAEDALERGAWGVMVGPEHAERISRSRPGSVTVAVENPTAALGRLAREWRKRIGPGRVRVVGITGSVGKTSVKDITGSLLGEELRVQATEGNLNTEIGLPLSVLAAPSETECLVLEMAMRGPGEISELCEIALPDVGVVTGVGPAHLESLGTVERVAAAKAELIDGLRSGAGAIVPFGEPLLYRALAGRSDLRTLRFADATAAGDGAAAELRLESFEHTGEGARIEVGVYDTKIALEVDLSERHNFVNTAIAVGTAQLLGLDVERFDGSRLHVRRSALRGEVVRLPNDIEIVNDCYNANPMSMEAALDNLVARTARSGARSVAVLGEMKELGSSAPEYHAQIGSVAATSGVDLLIAVGDLGRWYMEGYGSSGDSVAVRDVSEAVKILTERALPGDRVLVKASRSVGLDRVAESMIRLAERG